MALFKISKGSSDNLLISNTSRYAKEGSAWFTTDEGKLYIDIAGNGTSTQAVIGTNRIPLNAAIADKVSGPLTIYSGQKNNTFANEYTYDGSQGTILRLGHSEYYVEGNTVGTAGVWTGSLPTGVTLVDGFTINYKVGMAGAAAGTTLALNGGTAYNVYSNIYNVKDSIPVGTILHLVYNTVGNTGRWTWTGLDEKIKISSSSTNAEYPILASDTSSIISGNVYNTIYKSGITINPSTGTISATKLRGQLYNDLGIVLGETTYDEYGQSIAPDVYTYNNNDPVIVTITPSAIGALDIHGTAESALYADSAGSAGTADSASTADSLSSGFDIYYLDNTGSQNYDNSLAGWYSGVLTTGVDGSQNIMFDLTNIRLGAWQIDMLDDYVDVYAETVPLVLVPFDNSNPLAGGTAMLYNTTWWELLMAVMSGRSIFGQVLSGSDLDDMISNIFYLNYADLENHQIKLTTHNGNYGCEVVLEEDTDTGDIVGTYTTTPDYVHPTYSVEAAGAVLVGRDSTGHVTFGGPITPGLIGAVDKTGDYITGHLTLAGAASALGSSTSMLKFATAAAPSTMISCITANDTGFIAFSKGASYTDSTAMGYDGTRNTFRPTGTNTTATLGTSANKWNHVYANYLHGTADQVANNLTITLNGGSTEGTDKFTYNGSTAKTLNITAADVGAALAIHDHSGTYVPTTFTLNSHALSGSSLDLTASDVGAAATAHTHGNISSDGKIGTTANKLIVTTTGGIITTSSTLALPTDSGTLALSEEIPTAIGNIPDASTSTRGMMTTSQVTKLEGIAAGAEVNQNAFSNIAISSTTIAADSKTDTLTFVAGNNITLTPNTTNDSITIDAEDTIYVHPTEAGYKHIPIGGSTGQYLIYGGSSGTAAWGNLPATMPPSSHTHGSISNDGKVTSTISSGINKIVVTNSSNEIKVAALTDLDVAPKTHYHDQYLTEVTASGTSPLTLSATPSGQTIAISGSLENAYGDTKNPYGAKTAHYVLAGPTSGSAAVPIFRALVAADISDSIPDDKIASAGIWSSKQNALGIDGVTTTKYLTQAGTWVTFPTSLTPTSHTHGNISNDGKIGTTGGLIITTGTNGTLTAETIANVGIAASNHEHGYITTDGELQISNNLIANAVLKTDANGKITGVAGDANRLVYTDSVTGKISSTVLPSYVDDVVEGYLYNSKFYKESAHTTEITGETDKIYVDLSTNKTYRYGGSSYVEISQSLALGTTEHTAFQGDLGNIAYQHASDDSIVANQSSGLYKFATTSKGHVTSLVAVTKADITGLGIPGADTNTTYTFSSGIESFSYTGSDGSSGTIAVTPAANTVYSDITEGANPGRTGYLAKFVDNDTIGKGPQIGSATNTFLRNDGTWATPTGTYSLPLAANGTRGGIQIGYATNGDNRNYAVQLSSEKAYVNVPWISYDADTDTGISLDSSFNFKLALKTTTASAYSSETTTTTSRQYAVMKDADGYLSVNIPWVNTWTANSKTAAGYVATPTGSYKVWGTNSEGTPGWIDVNTVVSGNSTRDKFLRGDGTYTNVLYDKYVSIQDSNADEIPGFIFKMKKDTTTYKEITIEYDDNTESLCYLFTNF